MFCAQPTVLRAPIGLVNAICLLSRWGEAWGVKSFTGWLIFNPLLIVLINGSPVEPKHIYTNESCQVLLRFFEN